MNNTSPENGRQNFFDYLIILVKNSRKIIFVSAAVTVLTYLVLLILPNKYTATARLLPPQQNLTLSGQILESLGGGGVSQKPGGAGGGMAASLLGLKTPGDLYVGMMTGDTVYDRIIKRFDLMEVYKAKYIEDARKRLAKSAVITYGKKDSIISIKVTDKSAKKAAEIANAFCEELGKLLQDLSIQEARVRLAFLEKDRLLASQNLFKAEEAVRRFSEQNSVLQIDTQTRGALEYIARLRAEIDSKEVSIQVLRQQATPFNYDMVRLETEINGLKDKLRTAECQYDSSLTDVCLPTNKTPALALDYIRLYREAKFQESLYQLYIKLVEIARMDMARDITIIQVIDTAKPPQKRSNKRILPSILMGVMTFFFMIAIILGKEYLRNAEKNFGQQLLALKASLMPWWDMLTAMKNIFSLRKDN